MSGRTGSGVFTPDSANGSTTQAADAPVPVHVPPREGGTPSVHSPEEASRADENNSSHQQEPSDGEREDERERERLAQQYGWHFMSDSTIKELPQHLLPLAHEIFNLDDDDLVYIASLAEGEATKDVYSLLPYTGSNWFLPSIRECEEGERHWEVRYTWVSGLTVAIAGRRMTIRVLNIVLRIAFLVLCWLMLWSALPRWLVEPGGYIWDPAVLVVVSAIVGGLICRFIQIPPLVGVLWIGIMWNNIPHLRYLTAGIDKHVFDVCSKLGLTVILARAGFSLSIKGILPHWKQSVMLATLPFAFEGVAHSLIADKVFHYDGDYNWAFLQGMLCSIVSPAVVVPGTLYLQQLGYGRGVGPLSLMLSAVGVEIVIGVWCANFIIGLIFYDQKLAVAIVLGPVQFAVGVAAGILLGVGFHFVVELIKNEASRLANGKFERQHFYSSLDFGFWIFLFACFTMVFLGYDLSLAGGGCVMCVFFAATVAHMWLRGRRAELEEQKKFLGTWLAFVWDEAMMPVLFATMGAKIDVTAIFNADFFPKAIICMVCSTAVRFIVIFVIQIGDGMPWREKLLVCVGYLGKASAQASVGPVAANLVANMIAELPPSQRGSLATMQQYANNVQQMSAMYVMFMAVVASLGLVRGGTLILKRDTHKPVSGRRAHKRSAAAYDDEEDGEDGDYSEAVRAEEEEMRTHTSRRDKQSSNGDRRTQPYGGDRDRDSREGEEESPMEAKDLVY